MKFSSKDLRSLAYDLQNSKNPSDLLKAWCDFDEDFSKISAIVTLEEYREFDKTKEIVDSLNGLKECVSFLLESHNLYFLNEEDLKSMFMKGTVDFNVDYSVMFDTNFASYIRKFVESKNVGNIGNEFYQLIDVLIRNDFQYDYNIYLTENIKQVKNTFTDNAIVPDDIKQTIVCFEQFMSIDVNQYKSEGKIVYLMSESEAEIKATKTIDMYYKNKEVKPYMDDILNIKQLILLNLIGMFKVHFSSKMGHRKKMIEYFNFLEEHVGIFLEREAIIAYELFSKNQQLNIFNKISCNIAPSTLYERLDNIAWDFLIPRLMERSIAVGGEGDYFLPLLLTFDSGLHNMLKLYPIKAVIFMNGTLKSFPVSSINTYEFFNRKGYESFNEWMTDNDSRKTIAFNNCDNNYKIIKEQLNELQAIMFG